MWLKDWSGKKLVPGSDPRHRKSFFLLFLTFFALYFALTKAKMD